MFVKKLVEKASKKHHGGAGAGAGGRGLRAEDVNPRLIFHHGVPSGSALLAYDSIQSILAVATSDGRIKLFGKGNTQALLQCDDAVPPKFLQFFENQGTLVNVTIQNHIEVWDVEERQLCCMHVFNEEITSFCVMERSSYMYVGDCLGNITVLKVNPEVRHLIQMQYRIPFTESHGMITEVTNDSAVICILPQPLAETKRVLLIFMDGVIVLWGLPESKALFTTGASAPNSSHADSKKVVSACWACSSGSKVVVGYSNGEIFLWAIPSAADQKNNVAMNKKESYAASTIPLLKLNLAYKMEKVPIFSLRWVAGDGRTSHLYINGFSDIGSFHSFQVIILNESSESRMAKLVLPLTEACLAMEMISSYNGKNKHRQNVLVLLSKSGHLYLFDDLQIERYLLHSQSKSAPSLPKPIKVKLPYIDSSITVAKLYTSNSLPSTYMDEDDFQLDSKYPCLLSTDTKEKDVNQLSTTRLRELSKTKSLYITGHHDGAINFWDASCPLMLPVLSIKPQEADNSASGIPVTALFFDISSQILVSGDHNGLVQIITFKKEQSASENIVSFLQGKQGGNYTVRCAKVNGAIQSISLNPETKYLAIGTSKGHVFMIDMERITTLYQKQFSAQVYMGIKSLQFEKCSQNGYEKYILLVGMEDSSVFALEEDNGNELSAGAIHTKKPSKALLMQILDDLDASFKGSMPDDDTVPKEPLILVCSEKAVRLYFLSYAMQGIKKLYGKKKLNGSCCYAATFCSPSSDVGILLVLASGKIEIRSLPDLALLKEASLRGFPFSSSKSNPRGVLCASAEGELVAVNGDQDVFFFSILLRDGVYRHREHLIQVYNKDVVASQEGNAAGITAHKEKKKGIFSMVIKDVKGNKSKQSHEIDALNLGAGTSEELLNLFSKNNFPLQDVSRCDSIKHEDVELDIDDIDLDDPKEKSKGRNFTGLNKQTLGKKLLAIKGKLKPKTEEKVNSSESTHDDGKTAGAIDQIKKKYGYTANNESNPAKIAASKLSENVSKLQGINLRTSEMAGTAQSFSSMAKEVLRSAQNDRKI